MKKLISLKRKIMDRCRSGISVHKRVTAHLTRSLVLSFVGTNNFVTDRIFFALTDQIKENI